MAKLNYYWRVFATGFSFAMFGLGGLFATLFYFPLLHVLFRDRLARHRFAQNSVHHMFAFFEKMMGVLGIVKVHERGVERLANLQGTLICANHPTLIDIILILARLGPAQCVIKSAIFRNPFMVGVVTACGFIRNDGDPETLVQACCDHLNKGDNIVLFPEGTRTEPNQPMVFQRGFAQIAIKARAKIQMILIKSNQPTLTKQHHWYDIPAQPWVMTVVAADLLDPVTLVDYKAATPLQVRQCTQIVYSKFEERLADVEFGK